MSYIKSPLNYTGGKFKLLPKICPLFPRNIDKFIDLFGGGGNVLVNADAKKYEYNDINREVVKLLSYFKNTNTEDLLDGIQKRMFRYELSKTNNEGFLQLRSNYNANKDILDFYVLICYSFNNQIRFNSKGEFNMPFGKERSSFNDSLRGKFIDFANKLHSMDIVFTNGDFRALKVDEYKNGDFVYLDPPYLNSTATYNENGGWTKDDELDLLDIIGKLDKNNVKFGLSNNLSVNPQLENWALDSGLHIHYVNHSYSNCNYHKKDKKSQDLEVFICNYELK